MTQERRRDFCGVAWFEPMQSAITLCRSTDVSIVLVYTSCMCMFIHLCVWLSICLCAFMYLCIYVMLFFNFSNKYTGRFVDAS